MLGTGRPVEGDEWQLLVDAAGQGESVTSIRVVSRTGKTSQGGYGDQSVWPGRRLALYTGWDDEGGPNRVIVRVTQDVASVQVRLSDGRAERPELVRHPIHHDAQVAGLVFPHGLNITRIELLDANGAVLEQENDFPAFGWPRRSR